MFEPIGRRNAPFALPSRRTAFSPFRLLVLTIVFAASVPAFADVGPRVKVRLSRETTTPATSGANYSTVIEVLAGADGTIDAFTLSGEGWDILSVDITTPRAVRAGEVVSVRFQGNPADSNKPLHVTMAFNGRKVTQDFLFSAKRFYEGSHDGPAARIDGKDPATAAAAAMQRHRKPLLDRPRPPSGEGDGPVPHGGSIHLHVVGRLVYQRNDGMILGADAMWFQIMDEDTVSDEVMASGFTDANGNFDIQFDWDDCDITGCDDPDVYIRWETDNEVVNVQRADLFEEDYSWSTANDRLDDFTGNFIDFGTLMPGDLSQHPAIHIHNCINKAHHFIFTHDGTNVEEVDVQWPQSGTGAFYDSFYEEVHISPNEQWIEGTIIHEYGHHFINNYAILQDPDYCNGFCDNSDQVCGQGQCGPLESGGHCLWCPETDHDAWNEGWPNWFGGAVMRSYVADYGYAPLSINDSRYAVESLGNCCQDGQAHPAEITEAYITALLQDIEDATPDDHDGDATPDCEMDAMALGVDEIFLVTRLDQPESPLDFVNKWRTRYPQYDQDFWSTARNVALVFGNFELPTPVILSQPAQNCGVLREGGSLILDVTGNGALLKYQWRKDWADLSNGGGITGANTKTIRIDPAQPSHAGKYDCVVSTCDGTHSVLSAPVSVHVFPTPGAGQQVSAFGRNDQGQLGNGVLGWPNSPDSYIREVVNLSDVVQVSGGSWHTIALRSDGTVWTWGDNRLGALGQGNNNTYPPVAIPVPGLTDIVAVSANGSSSGDHNMALKADGTVWVWGGNINWELGNAPPNPNVGSWPSPVMIPDLGCVVAIASAARTSHVLKSDGTVWSWGWPGYGELGDGLNNVKTRTPVQAINLTDVVAINRGSTHVLALTADGQVWSWGRNNSGQLGDGSFIDRLAPVQVVGLTNVSKIRAGVVHSLALKNDNSAWTWGANSAGYLGDGTTTARNTPVHPVGMTQVVDLDGGSSNSIFLKTNGTAWVCGSNSYGELGRSNAGLVSLTPQATDVSFPVIAVTSGAEWNMVRHVPTPPYVGKQPVPQTTLSGAIMRISSDTYGTPPLTFQWYRNGAELANSATVQGALTASLTINPLSAALAGSYYLKTTNAQGSIDTITVPVTALPPPYCDEFTIGASSPWGNELGSWFTLNGLYKSNPNIADAYSTLPFELTDYNAEVDIVNANTGGIWARRQVAAQNTGVLLRNLGRNLAWFTYSAGTVSQPINQADNVYTIGDTLHLRIEVTGDTYKAYANGATSPTTQFNSAAYPSGRFGIRSSGQSFDHVCVSTGGAAIPPSGNLNGDGAANGRDIQPFIGAVLAGANDPGLLAAADFNGNGVMDVGDVPGFVQLLVGP